MHAALNDSKEGLRAADFWIEPWDIVTACAEVIERAARPRHSEAEAFFGAGAISRILGALIESHDDVGAESDLNVDRVLGGEEVRAAIEVRPKLDAIVT